MNERLSIHRVTNVTVDDMFESTPDDKCTEKYNLLRIHVISGDGNPFNIDLYCEDGVKVENVPSDLADPQS